MGSIHHLIKIISNLAENSESLRPLSKKRNTNRSNEFRWKEKHTTIFNKIKKQISKIIGSEHFDVDKET